MSEQAGERVEVFCAAAHDRNDLQSVVTMLRGLDFEPEILTATRTPDGPMIVGVTVPAGRADAAREAVSRWQAERHERMKADEGRLLTRLKLWLLVSTAAVGGGLALGLRWEAAASVSAVLLVMVFVYPDSHAATPAAACPPAEDEEDESEDDPADAYWMEGAGEGDSP